ncbi:thioesterase [Streptomyces lavendulae subsp. lavendulae]|uniref:thioesterase II family protein n=1 Tax=Streptomyces lavendulae TaxID=1914 RepID=UPI0024A44728|nr:alpha/beta fold hydrolase [Streptomyces lavendulae]GLV84809.1 thioesterase [Streptomyces lavendulae subsp. lavendulae]
MSEGTWTTVLRSAYGTPRGRVVALPHSGAGPNSLLPLLRRLPPAFEVVGVTLPGRERRFAESCAGLLDDPETAVDAVRAELCAMPGLPTVLFGHSMGSAFAAVLALRTPSLCQGLVLSGHRRVGSTSGIPEHLTEADVLDVIRLGGGTPDELLAEPGLRAHLLKLLWCDLTLGRRLGALSADRALPVPPLVLGGRDDMLVPPEELAEWPAHRPAEVRKRLFPGGHFYLLDEVNLDAVAFEVAAALTG